LTKFERYIFSTPPAVLAKHISRNTILPGFKGIPLLDVIKFFYAEASKLAFRERAAAVAFNFIMAIPPTAIFFFTLIPYLPIAERFHRELILLITDVNPNVDVRKYILGFVEDFFTNQRTGLLSLGFVLAIFYASNAVMVMIRTFDKSLHAKPPKRYFFQRRLRAIRLTTVVVFLLMGTILLLIGQGAFFEWIMEGLNITNHTVHAFIYAIKWILILCLFTYAIGFIYRNAPSHEIRWRIITPGSIIVTVLTVTTTWLFTLWVQEFGSFNKLYGSIGTLLIIMLLVFINSFILLIGFELNVSIDQLKAKAEKDKWIKENASGLEKGTKPRNLDTSK
jgi:membrane protein